MCGNRVSFGRGGIFINSRYNNTVSKVCIVITVVLEEKFVFPRLGIYELECVW
ncbi:MAG: hypothetical protein ACK4F9_00310 [Brevinematia bacterium]